MQLAPLYLKKREEQRLRTGHPWLFSNEVDTGRSPLKSFLPGQTVQVRTHGNEPVGYGYVNPKSLICVRLLGRGEGIPVLDELLEHRIRNALRLREGLFDEPFYRLIYGEGDALPGLVVDRYDDILVAQVTTAGMELMTDAVLEALVRVVQPKGILLRNDVASRELEGLDSHIRVAHGEVPDQIQVKENGGVFQIAPQTGQKTGWYYDHRANREWLNKHVAGAKVLDLFSYVGAFGIEAVLAGAEHALCVDSSEGAIAAIESNAALNGVEGKIATRRGNVLELVRELKKEGHKFDIVVADPPAFIKRRKDSGAGVKAYRRLYGLAMQLVNEGGLLMAASCSYHFTREQQVQTIARVARGNDCHAQILSEGRQSPDHPVHPALPETQYLKSLFVRVVAN
ncbi:MAG: class I SAM-dependent rRNA methyltransferase [Chromatiales bacterium]|jgi:23S rRNA (cytosine1962-C5)-methyltransferase|nr:class I SAM-dependent rRNA methyltransferase [Chromatiales bacterium]